MIGGGVAFAALGSSFAYAISKFKDVQPTTWLKVLAALFAIVALPTIIVAVAKLRRRNMSALLEAGGWAVNMRMRLTAALGRLFTKTPALPKESRKQHLDLTKSFLAQFPKVKGGAFRVVAIILVIAVIVAFISWRLFFSGQSEPASPGRGPATNVSGESSAPDGE